MAKTMVIDPQVAGVSGDMLLGALIDLGANQDKIRKALTELSGSIKNCDSIQLEVYEVLKHGLRGVRANVKVSESYQHRTGAELKKAVEKYLDICNLSAPAKSFALNCLSTILKAEARLHSATVDEVRLHEVGSADTLADIVGVATASEDLALFEDVKVYSLPVSVGRGKVRTSHGTLSIPIPVTLEILRSRSFAFESGLGEGELATPTGVSLLVNLAEPTESYPLAHPLKVGYGAGSRDLEAVPNLLRVLSGQSPTLLLPSGEIYVMETNVDDVGGEVVGYLLERLLEEGAKDACVIPAVGKNSRPSLIIKALADRNNVEPLTNLFFKETGTLGVRVYRCDRFTLQHDIIPTNVEVAGRTFQVNVKVARDSAGKVAQVKPEFRDAKKVALETGIPLREVVEEAKKAAAKLTTE